MDNVTEEQTSNVIEVSFSSKTEQLSQELESLLGQQIDDLLEDDPLEDLLSEFDDQEEAAAQIIAAKEKCLFLMDTSAFKLDYQDSPIFMGDTLIKQTEILKDDLKRLSYYLDELNIEA